MKGHQPGIENQFLDKFPAILFPTFSTNDIYAECWSLYKAVTNLRRCLNTDATQSSWCSAGSEEGVLRVLHDEDDLLARYMGRGQVRNDGLHLQFHLDITLS